MYCVCFANKEVEGIMRLRYQGAIKLLFLFMHEMHTRNIKLNRLSRKGWPDISRTFQHCREGLYLNKLSQ